MKRIFLALVTLVTMILVSSCQESKLVKVEEYCYVITYVDPPKRVYINLKRVSDGREFDHISLGKRLSNWRNIVVGDTISVKRYTYSNGSTEYTDFNSSEIKQLLIEKYNL